MTDVADSPALGSFTAADTDWGIHAHSGTSPSSGQRGADAARRDKEE